MARQGRKPAPTFLVDGVLHKDCSRCCTRRPLSEFRKKGNICKPCHTELSRAAMRELLENPPAERFWSYVDRRGPNECWPWMGGRRTCNRQYTPMSYGAFGTVDAHRIAWRIASGRNQAKGTVIRHSCDNPLCCNPAHLSEGTRADNQRDMQVRLRSGILGTKNPKARLTPKQVMEIRRSTESDAVLAKRYGVKHWAIYDARSGRKWRHLPGANPGFYKGTRKLSPSQVRELRALHRAGADCVTLGRRFGVSQATAWQAAKGNSYRSVGE